MHLGLPLSVVQVGIGDSTYPVAPGSGGSVTLTNTAPQMAAAGADARKKLLEHLAKTAQGGREEEWAIVSGDVTRGGQKLMTWPRRARRFPRAGSRAAGTHSRSGTARTHSEGVQFVDLRVDTETGVVYVGSRDRDSIVRGAWCAERRRRARSSAA